MTIAKTTQTRRCALYAAVVFVAAALVATTFSQARDFPHHRSADSGKNDTVVVDKYYGKAMQAINVTASGEHPAHPDPLPDLKNESGDGSDTNAVPPPAPHPSLKCHHYHHQCHHKHPCPPLHNESEAPDSGDIPSPPPCSPDHSLRHHGGRHPHPHPYPSRHSQQNESESINSDATPSPPTLFDRRGCHGCREQAKGVAPAKHLQDRSKRSAKKAEKLAKKRMRHDNETKRHEGSLKDKLSRRTARDRNVGHRDRSARAPAAEVPH